MKLMPIEAQRIGVGSTATDYRTSLVRQAVIDLQRVIPGYRLNHETIYYADDLVREGLAMRGVKPSQSAFKSLSIFRITDGECDARFNGVPHEWKDRLKLVHGTAEVNDKQARYSIDDAGYTFYVYPMPEDETWFVSMFWDGQKLDFQDGEQVPFDEPAALAVSYFVMANTAIQVKDDLAKNERFMRLYEMQKPKLYLSDKQRRGE